MLERIVVLVVYSALWFLQNKSSKSLGITSNCQVNLQILIFGRKIPSAIISHTLVKISTDILNDIKQYQIAYRMQHLNVIKINFYFEMYEIVHFWILLKLNGSVLVKIGLLSLEFQTPQSCL